MAATQLVSAEELNFSSADENLRIVDCRFDLSDADAGRRSYDEKHIPGAVFLDLDRDLASASTASSGRHPLPEPTTIAETLCQLGIDSETAVVVYDGGNGSMAVRAWWILRWLGHTNVRVLDGGIAAWSEAFELSSEAVMPVSRSFLAVVRPEMVVTTEEINVAIDDIGALNLLDARDPARFHGEVEPIDRVAGHIPGARNRPFLDNLNADGRWKSAQQLLELWRKEFGEDTRTPWIAMCGSGVTACHLVLSAMEAGYREPRLYVGSWSEWITDSSRPIAGQ